MDNDSQSRKAMIGLTIIAIAVICVYAARILPHFLFEPQAEPALGAEPQAKPGDPVLGNPSGRTIIEFGDAECPYCASVSPGLEQMVRNRGDLRLIWKDCPLPQHPNARDAAAAARCAGEQGKFWEYHDLLLRNSDNLGEGLYPRLAAELALDASRFGSCIIDPKWDSAFDRSLEECAAAGASELPWFHFGGKPYSGSGAFSRLSEDLLRN